MFNYPLEQRSVVQAIAPTADIITSNIDSRLIHMAKFSAGQFTIELGAGATGTTNVKLMSSDDSSKTNAAAQPFTYRTMNADGTGLSDYQQATTAGVLTPAGGGKIMLITFQADQFPQPQEWGFLRLTTGTSSAVTGSALFAGYGGRYQQRTPINPAV